MCFHPYGRVPCKENTFLINRNAFPIRHVFENKNAPQHFKTDFFNFGSNLVVSLVALNIEEPGRRFGLLSSSLHSTVKHGSCFIFHGDNKDEDDDY